MICEDSGRARREAGDPWQHSQVRGGPPEHVDCDDAWVAGINVETTWLCTIYSDSGDADVYSIKLFTDVLSIIKKL